MSIIINQKILENIFCKGMKIKSAYKANRKIFPPLVTFTVNPIPSDANVIVTCPGYSSFGNYIKVPKGSTVTYTVMKDGYYTSMKSQVVNEDTVVNVTLTLQTYPITTQCDGSEWTETQKISNITLTYNWRFPKFSVYVNNVLKIDGVKANNVLNVPGVKAGDSYRISQTRKYASGGNRVDGIIEDFASGTLPEGGLTYKVDITTEGGTMSAYYANEAAYQIYITTK